MMIPTRHSFENLDRQHSADRIGRLPSFAFFRVAYELPESVEPVLLAVLRCCHRFAIRLREVATGILA
jgi:hypothetical protein